MTTEAREFTEEVVAKHFGTRSNSGAAHELGKDKAKYLRMKRQAVLDKLIPDLTISRPWLNPDYRKKFDEAPLTEEQIRIRASVSLEEVDSYYVRQSTGDQNNLSKLAADKTPEGIEKFQRIRAAAMEYGRIPKSAPRVSEVKPPQQPQMLTLSNELCDRMGFPRGKSVTQEQFLDINTIVHKVDEQTRLAAEQAERDRAVDESLKSVGSIRETHGTEAAVIAEGLQRANVAKRTT